MFVKMITECDFAGCSTTHLIELPDGTSDDAIDELLTEMIEADIRPTGGWELLTEEEAEEMQDDGYDNIE